MYALTDTNGDMKADKGRYHCHRLNMPNGVAFHNGDLYVAEVNKIHKFSNIMDNLENPVSEVIYDSYPTDRHHGWKFIAFGPDGKLYVPVGAPCNVCDKEDENEVYATITRMNADGSDMEVYAKGVRNSVGFTWHPESDDMWFTDNGRDLLGDDIPACELNIAPSQGNHYGFPFWHQGDIADPNLVTKERATSLKSRCINLNLIQHLWVLRFYEGDMFPEKYRNNLLVAQHGSWNRSPEAGHIGYQLDSLKLKMEK